MWRCTFFRKGFSMFNTLWNFHFLVVISSQDFSKSKKPPTLSFDLRFLFLRVLLARMTVSIRLRRCSAVLNLNLESCEIPVSQPSNTLDSGNGYQRHGHFLSADFHLDLAIRFLKSLWSKLPTSIKTSWNLNFRQLDNILAVTNHLFLDHLLHQFDCLCRSVHTQCHLPIFFEDPPSICVVVRLFMLWIFLLL